MENAREKALAALSALAPAEREAVLSDIRVSESGRRRKPRDPKFWPPSMDSAEIEGVIDSVCGCGGRLDCDCPSVFNKAMDVAWTRHNTRARA
jgi:hypothetical protein